MIPISSNSINIAYDHMIAISLSVIYLSQSLADSTQLPNVDAYANNVDIISHQHGFIGQ